MTVIDAHQHVWDPARAQYDWLTDAHSPIDRRIGFEELLPSLRRAGVDATVLVQSADNDDDTDLMIETAAAHVEVAAIVAWVPLDDPGRAAEKVATLQKNPHIVGVRALIHDMPDPDWLLRPDVNEGLSVLEDADLTFDVVSVRPRHLEHVPVISERHPRLRIVIDHLSKPPIGGSREPWWTLIQRASENPLVHAKVSGLYPSVGPADAWSVDIVRPYFERALELFGADRLMYGGDWPISVLAGGYDRVWSGLSALIGETSPDERTAILGDTAERFYRIDPQLLHRATTPQHPAQRG